MERVSYETLCAALPKFEEFAEHITDCDVCARIEATVNKYVELKPQLLELYTKKYGDKYATTALELAMSADISIAANTVTEAKGLRLFKEGKAWPHSLCPTLKKFFNENED